MPIYDFQCVCGLQFEKSRSFARRDEAVKCQACGEAVERQMPTDVAGVFQQQTTSMAPQNTGISGFDHHVDRVIGTSADEGRAFQDHRAAVKRAVVRSNPGSTNHDLTELPDGTWDVMTAAERGSVVTGNRIHIAAVESGKTTNHDTYHQKNQGARANKSVIRPVKRRRRHRSLP